MPPCSIILFKNTRTYFFGLIFFYFGDFNQLSGDIKIFIVGLLWPNSHAVEGTQVGPKMEIRGTKSQLRRILVLYRVILLILMHLYISGIFLEIPDISIRNLAEVYQKGLNNNRKISE